MRFPLTCAALHDGACDDDTPAAPRAETASARRWPRYAHWGDGTPIAPQDDGSAPHLPGLRGLGLDGLIDAHCHWFPQNVLDKIWAYFDRHYWAITYRDGPEQRLAWLRRNGVHRFTTLTYAHRPGMAAWLNAWTRDFAARVPEAVPTGTFYPEDGVAAEVRRCIADYGMRGFKLHLRVSDLDPTLPVLQPAFAQVAEAGLPVVIHCGSAPEAGRFTAPTYIAELVRQHPTLRVVVAHMGAYEWDNYVTLAERHEHVYLDTTMVFVPYPACEPFPEGLLARLEGVAAKVLFGSDYPNIPYPLAHAVQGVLGLPLSDGAKRAMLHDNAARLFGLERA